MIKLYLEKRKKCERRKRQFWIRLGHTKQWWLKFLNDEVVADDWKENSRMSKQSLLVLCEERIQQDFKNLFMWRCKLLLKCIIFLTRDDLEKLLTYLE